MVRVNQLEDNYTSLDDTIHAIALWPAWPGLAPLRAGDSQEHCMLCKQQGTMHKWWHPLAHSYPLLALHAVLLACTLCSAPHGMKTSRVLVNSLSGHASVQLERVRVTCSCRRSRSFSVLAMSHMLCCIHYNKLQISKCPIHQAVLALRLLWLKAGKGRLANWAWLHMAWS